MIHIKQQLQWPEFLTAQYLHIRPRPVLKWIGILFLLLYFAVLIHRWLKPSDLEKMDYFLSGFAVWLLLAFFVILPYRSRRIYRQNKLLHHESDGIIDDTGLHFKTDISQSDLPWDHILKWKENKKLILLYPNDLQFFIFPKNIFKGNDINEFRELLSRKVQKKML